MLNLGLLCRPQLRVADQAHLKNLERQLALVAYEIKDSYDEKYAQREQAAVAKIKKHPKSFYSYAKSFAAVKSNIAMLLNKLEDVCLCRRVVSVAGRGSFSGSATENKVADHEIWMQSED